MQMRAQIRGAGLFGRRAIERSRNLRFDERLILSREPTNPTDRNAIILTEMFTHQSVGYVAREVAASVAPCLDRGELWLAAVLRASHTIYRAGRPRITYPVALLWRLVETDFDADWQEIWSVDAMWGNS
jgi:HIRAN domain